MRFNDDQESNDLKSEAGSMIELMIELYSNFLVKSVKIASVVFVS